MDSDILNEYFGRSPQLGTDHPSMNDGGMYMIRGLHLHDPIKQSHADAATGLQNVLQAVNYVVGGGTAGGGKTGGALQSAITTLHNPQGWHGPAADEFVKQLGTVALFGQGVAYDVHSGGGHGLMGGIASAIGLPTGDWTSAVASIQHSYDHSDRHHLALTDNVERFCAEVATQVNTAIDFYAPAPDTGGVLGSVMGALSPAGWLAGKAYDMFNGESGYVPQKQVTIPFVVGGGQHVATIQGASNGVSFSIDGGPSVQTQGKVSPLDVYGSAKQAFEPEYTSVKDTLQTSYDIIRKQLPEGLDPSGLPTFDGTTQQLHYGGGTDLGGKLGNPGGKTSDPPGVTGDDGLQNPWITLDNPPQPTDPGPGDPTPGGPGGPGGPIGGPGGGPKLGGPGSSHLPSAGGLDTSPYSLPSAPGSDLGSTLPSTDPFTLPGTSTAGFDPSRLGGFGGGDLSPLGGLGDNSSLPASGGAEMASAGLDGAGPAAAEEAAAASGAGRMPMMPMAPGMAGNQNGGGERQRKSWLPPNEDLWGVDDGDASPSVLGGEGTI